MHKREQEERWNTRNIANLQPRLNVWLKTHTDNNTINESFVSSSADNKTYKKLKFLIDFFLIKDTIPTPIKKNTPSNAKHQGYFMSRLIFIFIIILQNSASCIASASVCVCASPPSLSCPCSSPPCVSAASV